MALHWRSLTANLKVNAVNLTTGQACVPQYETLSRSSKNFTNGIEFVYVTDFFTSCIQIVGKLQQSCADRLRLSINEIGKNASSPIAPAFQWES